MSDDAVSTGNPKAADLEAAHGELVVALQSSTAIGDTAVLAVGAALNAIVEEATAQLDEAARSVQDVAADEGSLGEALKESSALLATYLDGFDDKNQALESQVQQAISNCREIGAFVKEFDDAVLTCDALAIFMKIAIARLPPKDQHVAVLADELRALATDLRRLAANVESVAGTLLRELTGVSESASRSTGHRAEVSTKLDGSITEIEELGQKLESLLRLSAAETQTNEIVHCSQVALSRLQYHDPLIQDLHALDAFAAELRTEVAAFHGDGVPVAPLAYAVRLGAGTHTLGDADVGDLESGELLLF
jgi:hypothetical protein